MNSYDNLKKSTGRTWAEINLDNIAHNAREIRRVTSENAEVMGIVKADAYGHGAVEVAKTLVKNGISRLGVSMLDEAIQLRRSGISEPILILSDVETKRCEELINNKITSAVFTFDFAKALSESAVSLGKTAQIHIKLDTGMGRVGFNPKKDIDIIKKIYNLPNIEIEGVFSHFAVADEDNESYTEKQFEKFNTAVNLLAKKGIEIPIKHIANSAAIIRFPHMHLNMVRAGIILYGLHPSDVTKQYNIDLKPSMTLKSRITYVKTIDEDTCISYGCTHTAHRNEKIATLPIGYADGFLRRLGNKAEVLICGKRAKIVGRVCMDQCMADVTDIENVSDGDKAIIFGEEISCDEVAEMSDSINYEIVCLIGKRVPRVYIENGNYIGAQSGIE